jgi:hypothetical protein
MLFSPASFFFCLSPGLVQSAGWYRLSPPASRQPLIHGPPILSALVHPTLHVAWSGQKHQGKDWTIEVSAEELHSHIGGKQREQVDWQGLANRSRGELARVNPLFTSSTSSAFRLLRLFSFLCAPHPLALRIQVSPYTSQNRSSLYLIHHERIPAKRRRRSCRKLCFERQRGAFFRQHASRRLRGLARQVHRHWWHGRKQTTPQEEEQARFELRQLSVCRAIPHKNVRSILTFIISLTANARSSATAKYHAINAVSAVTRISAATSHTSTRRLKRAITPGARVLAVLLQMSAILPSITRTAAGRVLLFSTRLLLRMLPAQMSAQRRKLRAPTAAESLHRAAEQSARVPLLPPWPTAAPPPCSAVIRQ